MEVVGKALVNVGLQLGGTILDQVHPSEHNVSVLVQEVVKK